jgi:hypothetical protein
MRDPCKDKKGIGVDNYEAALVFQTCVPPLCRNTTCLKQKYFFRKKSFGFISTLLILPPFLSRFEDSNWLAMTDSLTHSTNCFCTKIYF